MTSAEATDRIPGHPAPFAEAPAAYEGSPELLPAYLTVPECAQRLRISANGLYLAIQRGEAPFARRLGGRIVIPVRALQAWEDLQL